MTIFTAGREVIKARRLLHDAPYDTALRERFKRAIDGLEQAYEDFDTAETHFDSERALMPA